MEIRNDHKLILHPLFFIIGVLLIFVVGSLIYLSFNKSNPQSPSSKEQTKIQKPEFVKGQIIVKLKKETIDGASISLKKSVTIPELLNNPKTKQLGEILARYGGQSIESINPSTNIIDNPLAQYYKVIVSTNTDIEKATKEITQSKLVENSEPNYIVHALTVPNDPFYSSTGTWQQSYPDLWGIKKINAEGAWDLTTGSENIIVADIDTGVDRDHPDLKDNMWVNTKEIPNNGIDDDHNGYIDDYYGWDFANNDNDPMDDNGHGTHTTGTIAAVGNNGIGVVGVNWKTKVMVVKFLNNNGNGSIINAAYALVYAAQNGARVTSNSWGGSTFAGVPQILKDALVYLHNHNVITVAAAGNEHSDAMGSIPAASENVITVGASDSSDTLATFSNFGEKIDVVAPGVDVLSTRSSHDTLCDIRNSTVAGIYCRLSGTSMATPHVAGLAALLLSKNPNLTNEEVRQILRNGADDLGISGKDSQFGFGRINATKTISSSNSQPLAPFISSPSNLSIATGDSVPIMGSVGGPNFSSYKIEINSTTDPTWKEIASSTTQVLNGLLATAPIGNFNEGNNTIRLTATNTIGKTYEIEAINIAVHNFYSSIFVNPLVSRGKVGVRFVISPNPGVILGSYKLEWGRGINPTTWSDTLFTIPPNADPSQQIEAIWDNTSLPFDSYTFRLTANATNGGKAVVFDTTKIDTDMVGNWPKNINYQANTPAFADIDNDGKKELVLVNSQGLVNVFRKDGSQLAGFPRTLGSGYSVYTPVNVDDLNGDGKKEIVITATNYSSGIAKVFVINADGSDYAGWTQPVLYYYVYVSGPTIADLNNDGKKEIVVAEPGLKLHAYTLNGSELPGFPVNQSYTYPPRSILSPSIADVNNDGIPEIAVAINNYIYLFNNQGKLMPGWPFTNTSFYSTFRGHLAFGKIADSNNLQIIGFTLYDVNNPGYYGYSGNLFILNPDGAELRGGGSSINGSFSNLINGPIIADVDRDEKDDVIISNDAGVQVYNANTQYQVGRVFYENASGSSGGFVLPSDINNDGKIDFIADDTKRGLYLLDQNNTYLWKREELAELQNYLVSADVEDNGRLEIATGYASNYLWELPSSLGKSSTIEWPMFAHDPARTGRIASYTISGSLFLDTNKNKLKDQNDTDLPFNATVSILDAKTSQPLGSTYITNTKNTYTFTTFQEGGYIVQVKAPPGFILERNSQTTETKTITINSITPAVIADFPIVAKFNVVTPTPTFAPATPTPTPFATPTPSIGTVDTTPPSVTISSPSNGSTIPANGTNFAVNASDASGIASIVLYIDNVSVKTCAFSPCSYFLSSSSLTKGTHSLKAIVADKAKPVANTSSKSITVTKQ